MSARKFMRIPPVIALEVGTTKVCALVGEVADDGQLMITGLGECPSRGIRKGEVVDFDNALTCVRTALQQAEEHGQVSIHQVHLLVSGGHIRSAVNRGSVPILNEQGEITAEEMERVEEMARAVNLAPDREILHTVRQHYYVDDGQPMINPEGLEGSKLALDMLILHGLRNPMRNIVKLVRSAQVDVQDVAFGGLCSALAVLSPDEKRNGVLMVDLGGGATNYLVYAEERIADAGAFAVGGDHVSNDIAHGLRISQADAERLKIEAGSALIELTVRGQTLNITPGIGAAPRPLRLTDLHTIIHLRVEETLNLVLEQVRQKKLLPKLGGGIVLTGGGARLKNLERLATKVFDLPSRIGQPRDVNGLSRITDKPEYAAAVGMLRYGLRTVRQRRPGFRGLFKSLWEK
jgi:cell division protein FtsA